MKGIQSMYLRRFLFLFFALLSLGPPLFAQAQTSGAITSTQCVSINVGGQSTVGIQVTGTWTGTLVPKVSVQGQSPQTIQVFPGNSSTAQTSITANGFYQAKIAGGTTFLLCGSTVASGTASVYLNSSEGVAVLGFGTGTVTTVTASSPLQSSGGATPDISFLNQSANTVLAGPTSGGAAAPAFRSLVAADLFNTPGLLITSAGMTAPTGTINTNPCPSGQGIWQYIQMADATYEPVASLDIATHPAGDGSIVAGTLNHCWRDWWNDSGVAMPGVTNSLISAEHVLGHGGQKNANAAGIHERAFSAQVTNTDASFQGISQIITNYNEVVLSNSPHFYGHAGGETDVSGVRASIADGRTGNDGTFPTIIAGISSQVDRQNANAFVGTSGGTWAGVRSFVDSTAGGALSGTQNFVAFLADTLGNAGGLTGASVAYTAFWARKPTNLFPINQLIQVDNVGTGANDYDFIAGGVNSAGTAAGFNALVGPTVFGTQAHAASGNQIEVRSGYLSLLRARFSQATNLAGGDFALSAGWGTTASVSSISGKDSAFTVTITSAGTGQAANPTFTLTWKDGAWANAPFSTCTQTGGTGVVAFITAAAGTTTLVGTWQGTPVAASTYAITCHTLAGT